MSAAPSSEPSHTVASMKRILAAISSVTLALAVGAMGPASPAHARDLSPYEAKLQGLSDIAERSPFGERVLLIGGTPGGVGRWVGKSSAAAGGDVSTVGHGCCVAGRESPTRGLRLVNS